MLLNQHFFKFYYSDRLHISYIYTFQIICTNYSIDSKVICLILHIIPCFSGKKKKLAGKCPNFYGFKYKIHMFIIKIIIKRVITLEPFG